MFYFKEYSNYFLNNFKDTDLISPHDIPLLFGKGLVNKISKNINLTYTATPLYIRESSSSFVSLLSNNEINFYNLLQNKIYNSLISIDKRTELKLFKNKYPHLSWLSLDYNREQNKNLYSLLFKHMRSHSFLKLATIAAGKDLLFNRLSIIERKNSSLLTVVIDHKLNTFLNDIRRKILQELKLEQPDNFLELPPHISLMRIKNLNNEQKEYLNNIDFELKINITNFIILRYLNRVPDQPVFAVTKNQNDLNF